MAAIEALIQEIVRTPAIAPAPRKNPGLSWVAVPNAAGDREGSWEWYDSSYDLHSGLEVTEHHVPAALCAAVFQTAQQRYTRSERS